MKRWVWIAWLLAVAPGYAQDLAAPVAQLSCTQGPVAKKFGGTDWRVFACNDNRSVLVSAAPGNPGAPFYFMFHWNDDGYQLTGEGTGNKAVSDAAYRDLAGLTEKEIEGLLDEASAP